jgi:hypothetical protein
MLDEYSLLRWKHWLEGSYGARWSIVSHLEINGNPNSG